MPRIIETPPGRRRLFRNKNYMSSSFHFLCSCQERAYGTIISPRFRPRPRHYHDVPVRITCVLPQGKRDSSGGSGIGRVRSVPSVGGDDAESGLQGGPRRGAGKGGLTLFFFVVPVVATLTQGCSCSLPGGRFRYNYVAHWFGFDPCHLSVQQMMLKTTKAPPCNFVSFLPR